MQLVMDPAQPLHPHGDADEYMVAVHLRVWYLCQMKFDHCVRVLDYFNHRKVPLLIVNEEDVQTAVKATKAWKHVEKGVFDFDAVPQADGSVTVYIEWGDGMDGDILSYENDKEARKHLDTLIKNAN